MSHFVSCPINLICLKQYDIIVNLNYCKMYTSSQCTLHLHSRPRWGSHQNIAITFAVDKLE